MNHPTRIRGLRAGDVFQLGPHDWLVDGLAEKAALTRRHGWGAAHIWTQREILSLPWATPPTVDDVVRAFAVPLYPVRVQHANEAEP